MRAVRMLGRQAVGVVCRPDPEAAGSQVVVRVMASAICGSERHAYLGDAELPGNGGTRRPGSWSRCRRTAACASETGY